MPTLYNIDIGMRIKEIEGGVTEETKRACAKASEHFLGQKHVNHFGRVFEGYDTSCDTHYKTNFDIFQRTDEVFHRTKVIEKLKAKGIILDGDTQINLENALEDMRKQLNNLELEDPQIMMSGWANYMDNRIPEYQAIQTPLGVQDSHVHGENGFIIQFIKPKDDKHWYDFDQLRGYLNTVFARKMQIEQLFYHGVNENEKEVLGKELTEAKKIVDKYHEIILYPNDYHKIELPNDAPLFNIKGE